MKKIFAILGVMLMFSINCMAQGEEEEANMFGLTRGGITKAKTIDFGKLSSTAKEETLFIKNSENLTMRITGFVLPTGVGAMALQESIEDFSSGKVKITVDPTFAKNVNGKDVIINVSYFDRQGTQQKNAQLTYKIKAE